MKPSPGLSTLDQVAVELDVAEAGPILVRAGFPTRTVRINITMPEDLLAAVYRYYEETRYLRSGLLAQAVREWMQRDQTAA